MSLRENTQALENQVNRIRQMGGETEIEKQHAAGKLTVRERINLLFDKETFEEFGVLTHHASPMLGDRETPADGVVVGFGNIQARPAALIAYDFTVMAGSMGTHGETKVARIREMARERGVPIIWLLDSAGARIQEMAGAQFAGTGVLFRDQVLMSGEIPQVAAVMGPTAAGTSYIAALADFIPMVKGIGTMALGGPALVKAAVGEETDIESLGGSGVHTRISGVGHLECEDDRTCLKKVRDYLSFFPRAYNEPLPIKEDPAPERGTDAIFEIIPDRPRQSYDMRKVIRWLADQEDFFELQPEWAQNVLVGFLRIGGIPLGVVANQPQVLAGALDLNAADKAARFINLCDAFGIPLLYLHDCPGFMVGSKMEHAGIIRHGAKLLYATSQLTVPKISIVVRKSYGAGYYVMCGRAYEPDFIGAWPAAEISLMSPEGAAHIISNSSDNLPAMIESYREKIGAKKSAQMGLIDEVLDPRDTAPLVYHHLKMLVPKHDRERALLHAKKHGIAPV